MEKFKTKHVICFLWVAVLLMAIQLRLYSQDYLPKERENEIKMSGKYYWGEGSDLIEEVAKLIAFVELSNQIIQDAVGQSDQLDEILKAIDMGAHLGQLPQQGKNKILAWIAKDSVLLTVTTQRPITRNEKPPSTTVVQKEQVSASHSELVSIHDLNPVLTDNTVLQKLASCRTFNEIKRVATMNGLVRGQIGAGSKGFLNPDNCIIAVFTSDGTLSALLDAGGNSRTDMLSGNIIQNPEQFYNREGYYLLYMQQKNASISPESYVQNNLSSSNSSFQPPPIKNSTGYANAWVLLPKDWNGTYILINSFTWVWDENEDDDYSIKDNNEVYYKYRLSPNVEFEVGVHVANNIIINPGKKTINEFANYMYSLGYAVEGEDAYGIIADVTYENNMITKIVEKYVP